MIKPTQNAGMRSVPSDVDLLINQAIAALGTVEPDVLPHRLRARLAEHLSSAGVENPQAWMDVALTRIGRMPQG